MDDLADRCAHGIAGIGHQRERDLVAGVVLAYAIPVGVDPTEVVEHLVGPVDVVRVASHVGVVEVASGRTDGGPLRVAESVQHFADDLVFVYDVGDGLTELCCSGTTLSLLGRDVGSAPVSGLRPGVHVECEERGSERRASSVDGEISYSPHRY